MKEFSGRGVYYNVSNKETAMTKTNTPCVTLYKVELRNRDNEVELREVFETPADALAFLAVVIAKSEELGVRWNEKPDKEGWLSTISGSNKVTMREMTQAETMLYRIFEAPLL